MFLTQSGIQRGVAAAVILLTATCARAEPIEVALAPASSQPLDQVIYKGLVGNMLESVPLESQQRVELQRANAVISNTVSARSIAVLLGVASPVFLVGGLAWGIYAATRIKPSATLAVASTCGPDYAPLTAALSFPPPPEPVFPLDAEAPFSHGPLAAAQL